MNSPINEAPRWLGCTIPPEGWWCSREEGHEGPCAARPDEAPEEDAGPLSDAAKARIDAAWETYRPILATSTARPTERGAVEVDAALKIIVAREQGEDCAVDDHPAMESANAAYKLGLSARVKPECSAALILAGRLRAYRPTDEWGDGWHHAICTEAADMIERLAALTPPVTVAATDQARRDRIAKAVLDGWYEGNEEWDSPRNDMLRVRAYWAADAVLALPEPATERGAVEDGDGWVSWNPDAGEEYTPNHPIDSGECVEAEHVRRSTPQEDVLWKALQEQFMRAEALSAAALTPPVTVAATDQAGEVERLWRALVAVKQAARYVASGDGAYDPYASHVEAVDAIVDAALATQPATGRTMGGEVFDQRPQCTSAKFGPEPSLRQMVRFYYGQHGQTDPDGDTEQYFAALQNGGE